MKAPRSPAGRNFCWLLAENVHVFVFLFSLPPFHPLLFFTLYVFHSHLRSYFTLPFSGNELKPCVRFPFGGD